MDEKFSESFTKDASKKRVILTILQKVEILKELDKGSSAKCVSRVFGISVRSVYDIRNNKEKILQFYANSDSNKGIANRKRMREAKSADLDSVLFEWFKQRRSENIPITGPMLCQKAKEMHKELKIEESCEYSKGWLTKFKNRHGIRYLKTCGEKVSADKIAAEEFIDEFKRIVSEESLSPEQIYNMDETGLFWCNLPRKTFVSQEESEPSGVKDDKRRVTVLVCSNAAGTHKCRLLVVGKSAHPRCLKGVKILPVIYRSNKRAWITQDLCTEWFKNNFLQEVQEHYSKVGLPKDSKVLLLMDNCSAHPELIAPNVATLFLPPNTTSLIQPMDQGVINSIKCFYKSAFLGRLLNFGSGPNMIAEFKKQFTIKDCLYMLREAWQSVTQDTLINAWHKLWPESLFFETDVDEKEFGGFKQSLAKIKAAELLQYAKTTQSENLEEEHILNFLTNDDEMQTNHHLSDNEIIASVLGPEENSSESESDSEMSVEKITVSEGIAVGEKFLNFLETQTCVTEQEILTVRRIQEKLNSQKLKLLKQTKIDNLFKKC